MKNIKVVKGAVLALALLGSIALSIPGYAAESQKVNNKPSFGTPVNVTQDGTVTKATGDQAKCQVGKKGCDGVYYYCYEGAKRKYYTNNTSECGVEEDEYVLDKNGNKVCAKNKDGGCLVDANGNTVFQRKTVMSYMNIVINVVLGVIGVVAVVMIIIGGIQFTTSSGDTAKTTKAKNTIIFSVIGLVVALLAFAIVNFVLTNVFK